MRKSLPIVSAIIVLWIIAMFSTTLSDVIFVDITGNQITLLKNDDNNENIPAQIIFSSDSCFNYFYFKIDEEDPTPPPPWPPDTSVSKWDDNILSENLK